MESTYPSMFIRRLAPAAILVSKIRCAELPCRFRLTLLRVSSVILNKEFIRFLRIAKGSSGELRTQTYIAMGTGLITAEKGTKLISKSRHLSAMIQNLIKTRETNF